MHIVAKVGRAVVLVSLAFAHLNAQALQGPLKQGDLAALTDKSMWTSIPVYQPDFNSATGASGDGWDAQWRGFPAGDYTMSADMIYHRWMIDIAPATPCRVTIDLCGHTLIGTGKSLSPAMAMRDGSANLHYTFTNGTYYVPSTPFVYEGQSHDLLRNYVELGRENDPTKPLASPHDISLTFAGSTTTAKVSKISLYNSTNVALTVCGGARFESLETIVVGGGAATRSTSNAVVRVAGPGTTLVGNVVEIGKSDAGAFVVEDGATATVTSFNLLADTTSDGRLEVGTNATLVTDTLDFNRGTNMLVAVRKGATVTVNTLLKLFGPNANGALLSVDHGARFDKYFSDCTNADHAFTPSFVSTSVDGTVSIGDSASFTRAGVTLINAPVKGVRSTLELRGSEFNFQYPAAGTSKSISCGAGATLRVSDGATLDFNDNRFWFYGAPDAKFVITGAGTTVKSTNSSAFNIGASSSVAVNPAVIVDDGATLSCPRGEFRMGCSTAEGGVSNVALRVGRGATARFRQLNVGYTGTDGSMCTSWPLVRVDGGTLRAGNAVMLPNASKTDHLRLEIAGRDALLCTSNLVVTSPIPTAPTTVRFEIPAGGYAAAPLQAETKLQIDNGVAFEFAIADANDFATTLAVCANPLALGADIIAEMNAALPAGLNGKISLTDGGKKLVLAPKRGLCILLR